MEPVTPDGRVRKRIETAGTGDAVGRGAKVGLSYTLTASGADDAFETSASRRDGLLRLTLGRGKAVRGVEAVAESMQVGEVCVADFDGGGPYGGAALAKFGTVEARLEMVEGTPVAGRRGISGMTPRERFHEAVLCKEQGNAFFRDVKLERAAASYTRCLRFVEYVFYRTGKRSDGGSSVTGEEGGGSDGAATGEASEEEGTKVTSGAEGTVGGPGVEAEASEVKAERDQVKAAEAKETEEDDAIEVVDATSGDGPLPSAETSTSGEAPIAIVAETSVGSKSTVLCKDGAADGAKEVKDEGFVEAATLPETEEGKAEEEEKKAEAEEEKGGDEEATDDPKESEVRDLHVVCLNNMALCLLKTGDNKKVVELTTLSMQMDPTNHKPSFYRGRARHALGDWVEAKKDLLAAARISPKNMGIRIEFDKLNKKIKLDKERERKAAAAMFV